MRSIRDSIAGLMGLVVVVALALAALKTDSAVWSGSTALATQGILFLCVVGVVCRGEAERPRWLGAALFGWGYLTLAFWLMNDSSRLPTLTILDGLWTALRLPLASFPPIPGRTGPGWSSNLELTGHSLWALALAILGGGLSSWLFRGRERVETTEQVRALPAPPAPVIAYRSLVVSLTGLVVVALTAVLGVGLKPGLWAGVTFLVACGFLGIAVVGAVVGPAPRRAAWIAPALFGVGYLALTLGWRPYESRWPPFPTVLVLEELRPFWPQRVSGFPFVTDARARASARMLERLEPPMALHFPHETPLSQVLRNIQETAENRDGEPFPIFVDPIGLSEAERSISSTLVVDLDGVPLKHGLLACLKSLDLEFCVADGYLKITSPSNIVRPPAGLDPYMIVGQCLFAMLAAVVGALASLVVMGRVTWAQARGD